MPNVEPLHRDTVLSAIRIQHDASNASHWCFMHAQQAFAFSKNDKNYEEPESQYWSICSLPVVTAHWAVASGVWTPILPCLIVVGAEKTL